MHAFEFVLSILFLVFTFRLLQSWVSHRSLAPPEDPGKAAMLQRLDQLEERVRVLERIVTDERFDLKQQFKDLGAS
jgi:hypothetical protein